MSEKQLNASFSENERSALHSLAEMFDAKEDRDDLRQLLAEGATISELVMAYRTQKRLVGFLKAAAGLIAIFGAAAAALKTFGFLPGK